MKAQHRTLPVPARDPAAVPGAIPARHERQVYLQSSAFLGGKKFFKRRLASRTDVHSVIVSGIPYGALLFLVDGMKELAEEDVMKVLGISARTFRRQTGTPGKPMPPDLASKTWLLAETLALATEIFGDQVAAERWLARPAMGLDGQRPIDLLQTVQGAGLVHEFLGRLEHGVYT